MYPNIPLSRKNRQNEEIRNSLLQRLEIFDIRNVNGFALLGFREDIVRAGWKVAPRMLLPVLLESTN